MKKTRSYGFPPKNVHFSAKRLKRIKRKLVEKEPDLAKDPEVLDDKARALLV